MRLTMRAVIIALAIAVCGCATAPLPATPITAVALAAGPRAYPPPPAADSALLAVDQAAWRAPYSAARRAQATADDNLDPFYIFAAQMEPGFDAATRPALAKAFTAAREGIGPSIGAGKDLWKRPRPFLTDPAAPTCLADPSKLKTSGAYPSGHAALGYIYALMLADLAPAKHDDMLARGRDYGFSRVVCGVHWLSDVEAGRLLALDVYPKLKATKAFADMLAAAQAEQAKAKPGAPAPR
jgi:acid phosphatase (class A)